MGPSSVVVAAFDADAGVQELVEILRAAVALTVRSDLRFEIETPEGGVKDFNDVLRQTAQRPCLSCTQAISGIAGVKPREVPSTWTCRQLGPGIRSS